MQESVSQLSFIMSVLVIYQETANRIKKVIKN